MLPNRFMRWWQRKTGGEAPRCSARPCYLQDLFTTEEARGQGVGRALIEAVSERDDKVAERSGFLVYRKRL
jgi:GNAT superfamily N-acetyltransferase